MLHFIPIPFFGFGSKIYFERRRIIKNKESRSKAEKVLLALSLSDAEESKENFEKRQENEFVEAVAVFALAYREQIIRMSKHNHENSFRKLANTVIANFFNYVEQLPSDDPILNDETKYADKEFFLKGMITVRSEGKT